MRCNYQRTPLNTKSDTIANGMVRVRPAQTPKCAVSTDGPIASYAGTASRTDGGDGGTCEQDGACPQQRAVVAVTSAKAPPR